MKAILGFGVAASLAAAAAAFCLVPALFLYDPDRPIYNKGQEDLFTAGEYRVIYFSAGLLFASLAVVFAIDTMQAVRRRRKMLGSQMTS